MPRVIDLPAEFGKYTNIVEYIQRQSNTEYSSSCPKCGGYPHNGELPDRCRWFAKDHHNSRVGKAHGWCRRCGALFWPDDDNKWRPSPEELERSRQEREEAARAAKARIEESIRLLQSEKKWLYFHQQMKDSNRAWWAARGIPTAWQDFWGLGYCADKVIKVGEEYLHRAAYTIPKFDVCPGATDLNKWPFVNMDYRLIDSPDKKNRYRHEQDVPPAPFIARPDLGLALDQIIIVEGAKKAAVVYLVADDGKNRLQVLGLPGMSSWGDLPARLKNAGRVYIMNDPDSFRVPAGADDRWEPSAVRLAKEIGKETRIAMAPVKPDDMVTEYGATAEVFQAILRQARRV